MAPGSQHQPCSSGGTAWHAPPGTHRPARTAWQTVSHSGGCGLGFSLHVPQLATCTFYLDFFAKKQRDPFRKSRSLRPKGHGPEQEMAKPWDAARPSRAGTRQGSPQPGPALGGSPCCEDSAGPGLLGSSGKPGCPGPLPRGGPLLLCPRQPHSRPSLINPLCPRLQPPPAGIEGRCHGSGWWSVSRDEIRFLSTAAIAIAEGPQIGSGHRAAPWG